MLESFRNGGSSKSIKLYNDTTKVKCKVYEDNMGVCQIANVPKLHPSTRHLNTKYHHFRTYVDDGTVTVTHLNTELQPADMLTTPLPTELHERHCRKIMGW